MNTLPLELVREATKFSKELATKEDSEANRTVLLLAGVWVTNDLKKPFVLLPWSPLRETAADARAVDLAQMAKQWVLNRFASAILLLDTSAREFFKQEYPLRCVKYLVKGDAVRLVTSSSTC